MRSVVSYYLLLLYAVVIIRPVLPAIGDAMSHELNFMEHIATVHAIYGDNHVEKQMADSTSDTDTSKSAGTQKTEDQTPFHLPGDEPKPSIGGNSAHWLFSPFLLQSFNSVVISIIAPPPESVA